MRAPAIGRRSRVRRRESGNQDDRLRGRVIVGQRQVDLRDHAVGRDLGEPRPRAARELEARMQSIASEDRPLRDELWTLDEARAHLDEAADRAGVELLRTWRQPALPLGSYGRVYAPAPGPLLPSTGMLTGFRVVVDDGALLLVYGPHGSQATPAPERPTAARHSRPPPAPLLEAALEASFHVCKMRSEEHTSELQSH